MSLQRTKKCHNLMSWLKCVTMIDRGWLADLIVLLGDFWLSLLGDYRVTDEALLAETT